MIWIKMAAVSPVIYSSMRPCDRVYKRAFTGDCFFKGGIQFYQFAEYLKPILLMDDMRTKIESYFDEFAEVASITLLDQRLRQESVRFCSKTMCLNQLPIHRNDT
uniref:Uncharacterized protein n=1 Tax=Guillardia theta TaxID=55529 RepID=A0A6U5VS79_GUITH|mmetsp:Transcript_10921/g.36877  ORF Transcript_10921/g.36877 Transcript_10921/m.36877 type:complete len:105 (+) Transcript_10921:286-600(+)